MALTQDGDLYMASTRDNQVVITARYADGSVEELPIPQSSAAVESSLQVGVDETTDAVYVLWQKNTGMDARLRLAGYLDGTWIGPRTFTGGDGTAALNPAMLIHRAVSVIESGTDENGEPVYTELATTFLHLAWWSRFGEDDPGLAMYSAVEIFSNGVPQFNDMTPIELQGLFPFGIACFEFEANENLYHPKLFIDPASNNPHVLATDFGDCFFQILEIVPVVEDNEEEIDFAKRRRQIIILRKASMVALRPELPLARGKYRALPRARSGRPVRIQDADPRRKGRPRDCRGADPRAGETLRKRTPQLPRPAVTAGRFFLGTSREDARHLR
jgi:hypothetical protein